MEVSNEGGMNGRRVESTEDQGRRKRGSRKEEGEPGKEVGLKKGGKKGMREGGRKSKVNGLTSTWPDVTYNSR